MSRTHKDRPYDLRAADPKNRPFRNVYHCHNLFGRPVHRRRVVRDENGDTVYSQVEVQVNRFNFDGPVPRIEAVTVVREYAVTEIVERGIYADYCTAHISPRELPSGVQAPCSAHLSTHMESTSGWARSQRDQFWGGDRAHRRDWGRRITKAYRGNPANIEHDDDSPVQHHRHGVDWHW